MDTRAAARRWADTWQRCWTAGEPDEIAALYAPDGRYSTGPFREPYVGPAGALEYLRPVFAAESAVEARFGEPIVDGDRASIQWWASLTEPDRDVTYAGTSTLRFDTDGLVTDEWDSWNETDGRREPPPGWGATK
jgi:predicted SnoaL-like aldol condensation-catalyzing enzyme